MPTLMDADVATERITLAKDASYVLMTAAYNPEFAECRLPNSGFSAQQAIKCLWQRQ